MNFSIVLIAKNESKTLPRLLASLKEFQARGGEIVLVDTGSTDQTVEIARRAGCAVEVAGDRFVRVIDAPRAKAINRKFIASHEEPIVTNGATLFDYSAARNYAASLASSDIVWMPDCDEEFTAFDLDAIEAAINAGAERLEYDFVFAHDEQGKPALRFMHSKCYDRRKMKWVGVVHEVLDGNARGVVLPPWQVLLEHWQQASVGRGRYLAGLAFDCFLNPTNDRNSHYLARELLWTGRFHSAIKEFKRHIEMGAWLPEKAQSMIFIGDALLALGNDEEALASYHRAFTTDGSRREPLIRLMEYWWKKGDYQRTAVYASAALTIPWSNYYANQVAHYEHWPEEALYWSLWHLGDKEGSKAHFDKAFAFQPNNPKYLAERSFYYPEPELPWTGERYIPGKTPLADVETEHLARYRFAQQFTSDLVTLDAACGDGYGKTILDAAHYVGWDVEPMAVEVATKKYGIGYNMVDLEGNLSKDIAYDAIVSFETIEHLTDPNPFLTWASEQSKLFIGSIPLNMPSEFHKQVYDERQARKLIRQYWRDAQFFYQAGSLINDVISSPDSPYRYLIFVCGPKISIVIPTLGREGKLKRLEGLIAEHVGYPNYEVIVERDYFEHRQGAPKTLKKGIGRSTGDFVMFLGNDCVPRPNFLLNALKRMIKTFPDMDGLVGLNDGYWKGEFATHWLASMKLLPALDGEFFHTGYKHIGCDNELTERCRAMGKYVWAEEAEVYHDHPVQTGFKHEDMDDVYRLAYDPASVEEDRQLLRQRAEQFGFTVPEFYQRRVS